MSFNQKIEQIYELVSLKLKNKEIDESLRLIAGLLDIVEKRYPSDLKHLLDSSGVSKDLELWKEYGFKMNQKIDSLEIDPWKNKVEIKLGDEIFTSSIYNISDYVNKIQNITPAQKLVISSFLNNSKNFKIIQIYHNFLK
jgi:hypothetical protein